MLWLPIPVLIQPTTKKMKTTIRAAIGYLAVVSVCIAATPAKQKLTLERLRMLTAPSVTPKPKSYKVLFSGLTRDLPADLKSFYSDPAVAAFHADKPGTIEFIREFRVPTEFDPPQTATAENKAPVVSPTTPTAFETINAGWTVRLHAKQAGSVVVLSGVAEFVEVELVNGSYGALSGPIYNEQGNVITSNVLQQPLQQTTTTRFHLSAVPGETYEVLLYKGKKAEKYTVKVVFE